MGSRPHRGSSGWTTRRRYSLHQTQRVSSVDRRQRSVRVGRAGLRRVAAAAAAQVAEQKAAVAARLGDRVTATGHAPTLGASTLDERGEESYQQRRRAPRRRQLRAAPVRRLLEHHGIGLPGARGGDRARPGHARQAVRRWPHRSGTSGVLCGARARARLCRDVSDHPDGVRHVQRNLPVTATAAVVATATAAACHNASPRHSTLFLRFGPIRRTRGCRTRPTRRRRRRRYRRRLRPSRQPVDAATADNNAAPLVDHRCSRASENRVVRGGRGASATGPCVADAGAAAAATAAAAAAAAAAAGRSIAAARLGHSRRRRRRRRRRQRPRRSG